jgi:molybdopterin/thiamine biosynthesis adenylyltransferase
MGHAKLTNKDHRSEWPDFLRKKVKNSDATSTTDCPEVVIMSSPNAVSKLNELVKRSSILSIVDTYDEQFAELQLSLNAHLYRANEKVQKHSIEEALEEHYGSSESWRLGAWIYYPWKNQLNHILAPNDFNKLRTIRNRDLITKDEQQILQDFSVLCAGMSVGSASALSLVLSGISRNIIIADGAVISGSNLNRILAGVSDIGMEKSLVIARMMYEMNPYLNVHRHDKIIAGSMSKLFEQPWQTSAVIDEVDDLEVKIRLRLEARKRKLPVFMATELADSVMLDVERFDLEPERPIFHDLIPGIEEVLDRKDLNHREWMKYAARIIGTKNMPIDMQKSLMKIGSTIVTHPQLGSTVMMTGGVTTFAVKQVALGKSMPSGRFNISLNDIVPENKKMRNRRRHKKHTKVINKALDSM